MQRNVRCESWLWAERISFCGLRWRWRRCRGDLQFGRNDLNGIDPENYLRNVLSRIANHPIKRIEELLPWNVAASLSPEIDEAA
jgi:hypothetical protein